MSPPPGGGGGGGGRNTTPISCSAEHQQESGQCVAQAGTRGLGSRRRANITPVLTALTHFTFRHMQAVWGMAVGRCNAGPEGCDHPMLHISGPPHSHTVGLWSLDHRVCIRQCAVCGVRSVQNAPCATHGVAWMIPGTPPLARAKRATRYCQWGVEGCWWRSKGLSVFPFMSCSARAVPAPPSCRAGHPWGTAKPGTTIGTP